MQVAAGPSGAVRACACMRVRVCVCGVYLRACALCACRTHACVPCAVCPVPCAVACFHTHARTTPPTPIAMLHVACCMVHGARCTLHIACCMLHARARTFSGIGNEAIISDSRVASSFVCARVCACTRASLRASSSAHAHQCMGLALLVLAHASIQTWQPLPLSTTRMTKMKRMTRIGATVWVG